MKFLPLLAAVLCSIALVSADSPAAVGAEKGKVPQLLDLINKFEHANPSSPAFLAQYASEIPALAELHREVVAQGVSEKSMKRLYGDNEGAKKLLELVQGVKTEEKREVKSEKKTKKVKSNNGKSEHANANNKGKSAEAHKNAEVKKQEAAAKKDGKKAHPEHPAHPAHPTHPEHGKKEGKSEAVNHHKQGAKQSTAHKSTHAAHPTKPETKEHKKPAHKHKTKSASPKPKTPTV